MLADLGSAKVISNVLDFRTIHARAECCNRPKPRLLPCRNRWHMTAKLLSPWELSITYPAGWGKDERLSLDSGD